MSPSHLPDSSNSNPKDLGFKKQCAWCGVRYNSEFSDSLQPDLFCELKCQMEHDYTT